MSDWPSHVLPHGPLVPLHDGAKCRLWTVTGTLPRGEMPRTMVVHKLPTGRLLVHSVIALDEPTMTQLLALGEPEVMIVPNAFHRLDAGVWLGRFPQLKVLAPAAARAAVTKRVPVDDTCEKALAAYCVDCLAPDGLKPLELWYQMESGQGPAFVVTDTLMNLPHLPGLAGWLFKVLGSTGFFGMTRLGRLLALRNRTAFKSWLLRLAATPRLQAVIVAHGAAVTENVPERLREAAARL